MPEAVARSLTGWTGVMKPPVFDKAAWKTPAAKCKDFIGRLSDKLGRNKDKDFAMWNVDSPQSLHTP